MDLDSKNTHVWKGIYNIFYFIYMHIYMCILDPSLFPRVVTSILFLFYICMYNTQPWQRIRHKKLWVSSCGWEAQLNTSCSGASIVPKVSIWAVKHFFRSSNRNRTKSTGFVYSLIAVNSVWLRVCTLFYGLHMPSKRISGRGDIRCFENYLSL